MADFRIAARKNAISTGTALKTLLQIVAPANQRLKLLEVGASFHGTVNTNEPIQTDLMRQTTAGTMSALTPVKLDDSVPESIQSTAQHTATAEPTASDVLSTWAIHPQTGLIFQQPIGEEVIVKGGGRLGLVTTAPNSVNADVYLKYEE